MTTKIDGIGKRASFQTDTVFNNIFHVIDMDSLRESYQAQDGKKALGIDEVTKEMYGKNLEKNLVDLLARIKRYAYNPKASRIVEIPKEDGSTRPLAITCFEDKIVQTVVSQILAKIYEPLFLPCSFGYREGMKQHDALRALMKYSNKYPMGVTVEIDLSQYFNSIPHSVLFGILKEKVVDRKFLKLIEKLVRAPTMVNGKAELNKIGVPQGSCLSPILANIYLHHVIDNWFEQIRNNHFEGKADMVRFADDMVFVFQHESDAMRFYNVLPKRLQKFGLKMNDKKSSIIKSGAKHASEAKQNGERLQTYKFLGFTCYWGQGRSGKWRLKYKSRSDRVTKKLNSMRAHLKENLHKKTHIVIAEVKQVVVGWGNYHAISDNQRQINSFIYQSKRALFCYINRKGGKRKTNWKSFANLLKRLNFPTYFKTTSMFHAC
jgi:group II intron reverse transcriptase/maturase